LAEDERESDGRASRKAAHVQKGKKKPSEERISNFIARIAAHEETNGLEPIDKASLRVLANYQAVTKVKA
jgi:trimethylamine:corrinoid methyltransferase-like protein